MHRNHLSLAIVVLVGVVPFTTGCVGYLAGWGIDAATKTVVVPSEVDSVRFKAGNKVKVRLMTGEPVSGRFRRVEPFPDDEYAARYGAGRQDLAARAMWVPPLGATIDVVSQRGDTTSGEFLGLEHDGVVVRPQGETQSRTVSTRGLSAVRTCDGTFVTGQVLDSLLIVGTLPVRTSLVLEVRGKEERRFPLNAIARIERTGSTWRWTLAAVDAVAEIVIFAATWDSNFGNWSWN